MTDLVPIDARPLDGFVDVAMTETHWAPQGDMPWEQWHSAVMELARMNRAGQFWLGDAILYGEARFGDMYAQAIELTGLDYATVANAIRTARAIPPDRRRESLTYSHHLIVAALPAPEQDEWLQKAEEDGLTVQRLRSRLNQKVSEQPIAPSFSGTFRQTVTLTLNADSTEEAHDRLVGMLAPVARRGVQVEHGDTEQVG